MQREIAAASSRIALHTELIAEFRSLADRVECAFWESNENEIDLGLQAIEDAFGQSLWLLECRIAYKQVFHGLEAQKKYVQDVRKVATAGIAGNVAYDLSVKNEPNVSHARFSTDLERRLLKAPVPESAKIYLNVRLADRWPSTPAGFAGRAFVDDADETMTIRCESDVRKGAHTSAVDAKLNDIRTKIADGTYKNVLRKEGGTGLKRLANLVQQSSKGRLEFGFSSEEAFFVELVFSFFTVPERFAEGARDENSTH